MTVRRKDSARSARSRHSSSVRSLLSSAIRPPGSGPARGETRSSTPAVCPGVEHLSAAYTQPHDCALCEQSGSPSQQPLNRPIITARDRLQHGVPHFRFLWPDPVLVVHAPAADHDTLANGLRFYVGPPIEFGSAAGAKTRSPTVVGIGCHKVSGHAQLAGS